MAKTQQQPAERVVARLRPHARALFWPSAALIAICTGVGYYFGSFPELWENLLLLVAGFALALLLFLLPLGAWLSKRYTITTRRLILQRGFFVRVRQELMHSRGYDILVRKNWLQSAFGSGDVQVNSGLEKPVVLSDVPRANLVQGALQELMESGASVIAARRQREQSALDDETAVWGTR